MHGFSIAEDLLRKVLKEAEKRSSRPREVHVEVGELVFPDSTELETAWELLAKDTPAQESSLRVKIIPASIVCPAGHEATVKLEDAEKLSDQLTCARCGKPAEFKYLRECVLSKIVF